MTARLVYDGSGIVHIPPEMGVPRPDQMQGTVLEQLCELAGRICYDSLGKGRPSADFHEHIREVGHTSIWEHAVVTLAFPVYYIDPWDLVGRKGIDVFGWINPDRLVISANLRAISEWFDKPRLWIGPKTKSVGPTFRYVAEHVGAPQIIRRHQDESLEPIGAPIDCVDLGVPEHQPVTLYLSGSRGFGYEMLRHRYARSERSTRYCDSSETPWIWHPDMEGVEGIKEMMEWFPGISRQCYERAAGHVEKSLWNKGVDKTSARKRARGAARGFLGHALQTEMLFTATVLEWKDIIRQRLSPAADPEIAGVIEKARDVLRRSRVGVCFK